MIKGVNGWTFPRGTEWAEAARQAQRAGFEALEPTLEAEGQITRQSDEAGCRRLGDAIRAEGIEVASLATGLFWQMSYSSPDANLRQQAKDLTLAGLDCARWLETSALLVVPGMVGHFARPTEMAVGYADAWHRAIDALAELAPEAEARGVVIALENVWNQFLISPLEMRQLIDEVNSPWVAAYLDVGNVLRYGFPQDWIETLAGRISRVHLKDYKLSVGTVDGFCPLTDGDVVWPAVMSGLMKKGYDGPITYEGPGDLADISRRIDRLLAMV